MEGVCPRLVRGRVVTLPRTGWPLAPGLELQRGFAFSVRMRGRLSRMRVPFVVGTISRVPCKSAARLRIFERPRPGTAPSAMPQPSLRISMKDSARPSRRIVGATNPRFDSATYLTLAAASSRAGIRQMPSGGLKEGSSRQVRGLRV